MGLFSNPCIAYKKLVHLYLQNQKPHKNDSLMGVEWRGIPGRSPQPNGAGDEDEVGVIPKTYVTKNCKI